MINFNIELLNLLAKALQRIQVLQNLIEKEKSENRDLRAELQQLRDENNRLKGEQARPNIKPNKKNEVVSDPTAEAVTEVPKRHYSSESQRPKESPGGSRKKSKRDQIKIDREVVLDIDPDTLPVDAQFKGYQEVIVQDIKIEADIPSKDYMISRDVAR